jgi:hypothetical protein
MLKELGRESRTAAVADWPDPPLPEAAAARRRITASLILLAALGLAGMVVSYLAG